MNYGLPGNRMTRILLITGAVLAVIVASEWFLLQRTVTTVWSEPQPAATGDGTLEMDVYPAPGIDAFEEILARPLFIEGREPPEEPETPQTAEQAPAPVAFNLQLEGLAVTLETRVAVVREINTRKLLRLTEGMEHDGWKLEHVSASRAVFTKNAQVRELTLELETGAGAASKPARATGRQLNYAGKPVTLDEIRMKKQRPPASSTPMVPAP